jgi:hypothetical protein
MKMLMKLSLVLANCVVAFAALGQVQNNSCSIESFLAIRLEQVKIDGQSVIEAWNQVIEQVKVEHPGVAEIAVCFDPVSADPSSTAVPQSRAVDLKLELNDVTVRELASMIAELAVSWFSVNVRKAGES